MRSEQPYVPLIATTLCRYGIPARFYFQTALREHSLARFFTGFLDAVQSNWSYAALIPLVTSPYAGLAPAIADAMDHLLRSKQPAFGIPDDWIQHAPILRWTEFTSWSTTRRPPAQWAASFATLRSIVTLPPITDGVSADQILEWRSLFAALDAWDAALKETAAALDPATELTLEEFRRHLGDLLEYIPVQVRDDRRNVVHVIDVYEARQWRLPVVFVCGLLERVFPQYHSGHPILNDDERLRLRSHGVLLRTSDERQREETTLFAIARGAATREAILSCPRANLKGDQTLPSFFLDPAAESQQALPNRPRPQRELRPAANTAIESKDLLALLRKARATLSPTAIETYLQCPYQFFARDILKLAAPPETPHDRLDFLMQGDILHKTLAETEGSPLFVDEIFNRLFEESCAKKSVPAGHRTERVRLEVHANLRRFLESPVLKGAKTVGIERGFKITLEDGLQIRGKIDRVVEVGARGLIVIDYKYSSRNRVRDRVRSHDRGELVQGGLYLWAAEKLLKGSPAGMLYCGLRGEVSWNGWHVPIFGWQDLGESWDVAQLRDMMDRAKETSSQVAASIAQGIIAPAPADTDKCKWCDARDACRIESKPAPLVQVASS
ncbi:MAG: PD-(D/E)XK nuclease family protein [Acidobacteria bacterium]|nr:PD-(D/E)XK nuclease family protein [Acidobacteriota bacterium]